MISQLFVRADQEKNINLVLANAKGVFRISDWIAKGLNKAFSGLTNEFVPNLALVFSEPQKFGEWNIFEN